MDEKKIHSIIDEAMAARDRSVSIYISPDGGVSVSVFPWPDEYGGSLSKLREFAPVLSNLR